MQLTDFQKSALSSAGFTDREITLYRQKFYNLFNTQPVTGPDLMRNLEGFRDQRDECVAALKGVVRVADRATVEFDAARAAIARCEGGR